MHCDMTAIAKVRTSLREQSIIVTSLLWMLPSRWPRNLHTKGKSHGTNRGKRLAWINMIMLGVAYRGRCAKIFPYQSALITNTSPRAVFDSSLRCLVSMRLGWIPLLFLIRIWWWPWPFQDQTTNSTNSIVSKYKHKSCDWTRSHILTLFVDVFAFSGLIATLRGRA